MLEEVEQRPMNTGNEYDLGWHFKFQSKGLVKLIQRVKIAHSFLQYVSNLFHFTILSFAALT